MSPDVYEELKEWHVLILDIDDYSLLDTDHQRDAVEKLTKVVQNAPTYRDTKANQRMALPTGDGLAVAFRGDLPQRPLKLAQEIHRAYGGDRLTLKIGIDSGIAFQIKIPSHLDDRALCQAGQGVHGKHQERRTHQTWVSVGFRTDVYSNAHPHP